MHHAQVRVRGKQVEEMHGQDIRNSEELKSQKQEQCQQSMDQTLNVKMMDDNNEIFKHDIVVEGADLSSSTSTSLTRPVRTTQFSQERRWSPATREDFCEFAGGEAGRFPIQMIARPRRQQSTETRKRRTSSE